MVKHKRLHSASSHVLPAAAPTRAFTVSTLAGGAILSILSATGTDFERTGACQAHGLIGTRADYFIGSKSTTLGCYFSHVR
jgi:hypothetical protein